MHCLNPHISLYVHTRLGKGMLPARPRLQTGVGAARFVCLDPCRRTCKPAREEEAGKVQVIYGVHSLEAGLVGRTVISVREALAQPLNISPRAVALVNGQEVDGTHVLLPGELLEFVRYAGEKGLEPAEASPPPPDRALMEKRFGQLGDGVLELTINGQVYDLYALLEVLGLAFEDIRPIDAHVMGTDLYAIRYFDSEDRSIVAYEFDA